MADKCDVFSLRTFCVVTGASKGFGKKLSVTFATKFPKGSVLLLLARNGEGLADSKCEIAKQAPDVHVIVRVVDLSKTFGHSSFQSLLSQALESVGCKADSFEQAVIVHNAGSMGDISKKFSGLNNEQHLNEYWTLNLTSMIVLNSVFLKTFESDSIRQKVVIGISSICALQPFKTWSLYCSGKAARDMLFRTMALEDSAIRVLNYAPGPIDTDMQAEVRQFTGDPELRSMFHDFKENGTLLTCEQSLSKLVPLLEKNTFDSGAHIDYYDV